MANDYCGPVDNSVLYDQANHISTTIWNGGLREKLTIRQSTSNLGEWHLHDYQVHLLRQWGFGMFVNPKSVMQNDVSLITALVERWRPETNTFHFTFGEMTVTLEDVYMLMGLPVVGEPIRSDDDIPHRSTWLRRWHDPELTEEQRKSALDRGGVKLKFLRAQYGTCPSSTDRDMMVIYTRAYVLYLCGAILFPTKSNNVVHPRLILFLEDPSKIYGYAWGAAVLAYLYRNLQEASRKDVRSISGCTTVINKPTRTRQNLINMEILLINFIKIILHLLLHYYIFFFSSSSSSSSSSSRVCPSSSSSSSTSASFSSSSSNSFKQTSISAKSRFTSSSCSSSSCSSPNQNFFGRSAIGGMKMEKWR